MYITNQLNVNVIFKMSIFDYYIYTKQYLDGFQCGCFSHQYPFNLIDNIHPRFENDYNR